MESSSSQVRGFGYESEGERLAFLGAGKMAKAIMSAILREGVFGPRQIIATHHDQRRLAELHAALNVGISGSSREAVETATIVLLCVRPQQIHSLLSEVADLLVGNKLVVSIAAGISGESILSLLPHTSDLVHVHPTSLAFSSRRLGVSYIAPVRISEPSVIARVERVFCALGQVKLIKEDSLPAYILMAGCMPGYLAQILSEFMAIARDKDIGLPEEDIARLADQLLGVLSVIASEGITAEELVSEIATQGGVTRAGLDVFRDRGLRKMLKSAAMASLRKLHSMDEAFKDKDAPQQRPMAERSRQMDAP